MENKVIKINNPAMQELIKELDSAAKQAALPFRAYNNATRKQLIRFLLKQTKPVTVTEIYRKLDWEQSVCSQHLKILRDSSLVTYEMNGKERYYKVNEANFQKLLQYSRILQQEFPAVPARS